MAIAKYPSVAIDCPDPAALARFYGALLGWEAKAQDGWVDLFSPEGDQSLGFQPVADYRAPQWPDQEVPQQMHLDLAVEDLDAAEKAVIELGATKADHQPGTTFRVFLDPAGHPFCLCLS